MDVSRRDQISGRTQSALFGSRGVWSVAGSIVGSSEGIFRTASRTAASTVWYVGE